MRNERERKSLEGFQLEVKNYASKGDYDCESGVLH